MTQFEVVPYGVWQRCYRASNGSIELIVTGEVGPRILRFGFIDQANELKEYPERFDKVSSDEWVNFGGHRLWHAPEDQQRTYYPDNRPVTFEQYPDFGRFTQPVEVMTGIEKMFDIAVSPDRNHAHVVHRLRNHNLWDVTLAPWALSVMEGGGTAIIPMPPRGEHPRDLQPASNLTLWAYTDISDSRWVWGRKYILLRQDSNRTDPEKLGAMVTSGWVAYARAGHCLIKTFTYQPGATYPDMGSSVEVFTNSSMLEVETLGPLTTIPPGGMVEHVEDWFLFDDVLMPENDAEVDASILPLVQQVR
jgi:hypothetical protein